MYSLSCVHLLLLVICSSSWLPVTRQTTIDRPHLARAKHDHEILGVSRAATPNEVGDAYVGLAFQAHPDRHEPYLDSRVQQLARLSESVLTLMGKDSSPARKKSQHHCVSLPVDVQKVKRQMTPLILAAMRGDKLEVAMLLQDPCFERADIEQSDVVGMTALHWAAQTGSYEIAEMLLAAGATTDARTKSAPYYAMPKENGQGYYTPLMKAAVRSC